MRKLTHNCQTAALNFFQNPGLLVQALALSSISLFGSQYAFTQCQTSPNAIKGSVYMDLNYNGIQDPGEPGKDLILIKAFNNNGDLIGQSYSDVNGDYVIAGLSNLSKYRLELHKPSHLNYAQMSNSGANDIRMISAPACGINWGLQDLNVPCNATNARLFTSCFVKDGGSSTAPTLVEAPFNFKTTSSLAKLAMQNETGSVWGLAWNKSRQTLYSSAFTKYGASFGPGGSGGIYETDPSVGSTQLFLDLQNLGISTGQLQGIDPLSCNYSSYVGKTGLGDMDISDDDRLLFVTNLYNKSLVIIPTDHPTAAKIMEIKIPDPGCNLGDYVVGAVEYYNGFVYLGVTCTAEKSGNKNNFKFHIYEFNLLSRSFNLIFTTPFAKEYWLANPGNQRPVSQWLSNIAFVNPEYMILGIADRTGHTYCDQIYPLTGEFGDILMLWKSPAGWLLENKGKVGTRTGNGVNHNEGPGGGEFFGDDFWTVGPGLHPEVSFGSVAVLGGVEEVISTCFDPVFESFSGGFHKYNTLNGKKLSALQLYNKESSAYGKSAGLGDLAIGCPKLPLEIGNFVWLDDNENGIQDPEEDALSGIRLQLLDKNCNVVGTTITDGSGYYFFNASNVDVDYNGVPDGLKAFEDYYLLVNDPAFDYSSGFLIIGNDTLKLTAHMLSAGVELINSDAEMWSNADCPQFEKMPVVKIHTGSSGQNDFGFDIGFIRATTNTPPPPPPPVVEKHYDLALIKKVVNQNSVMNGEYVTFDITVYNQGNQTISQFEVTDYINDYFLFDPALNPSWILNNKKAKVVYNQLLAPGQEYTVQITLQLNSALRPNEIINTAEISDMRDLLGISVADDDSTPDDDEFNDKGGVPNSISDNNITNNDIDEDDHDRESLPLVDLALRNTTVNVLPVKKNELVTFRMEIFNQGNVAVSEIDLVNYIPTTMLFDAALNPAWIANGSKAYLKINEALQPGQSVVRDIHFKLQSIDYNSLVNVAEIFNIYDASGNLLKDFDSTPDDDATNDAGGAVNTLTDDIIDNDGTIDEDDADPATIVLHDLALILTTDQLTPVQKNQDVLFKVTVCNQGSAPVKNVGIVYYLPAGLDLSPLDNNSWFTMGGLLRNRIQSELIQGKCMDVPILLNVKAEAGPLNLLSRAEIVSAEDLSGNNISDRDLDSYPDLNALNDAGGNVNSLTDNIMNGDGLFDEDDADPAGLSLLDLALIKTYTNGSSLVHSGTAFFEITVYNQGNIPVRNIELTDYLPDGFDLNANSATEGWSQNGRMATMTLNKTLDPYLSTTVRILLDHTGDINPASLVNVAEISKIFNEQGGDISDYDFDSTPDQLKGNDPGGIPDSSTDNVIDLDANEDEDDADPAGIPVFDLALTKKLVETKLAYIKGDTIEYVINVINQGNVIAEEIEIVDYLDGEYIFDGAINPAWTSLVDGKVRTKLAASLQPGDETQVSIYLIFASLNKGKFIPNYAEIASAQDEVGNYAIDFDSFYDDVQDNDKGGVPGSPEDNRVDDHGEVDEDDHDGADSNPVNFDLALLKDIDQVIVGRNQQLVFNIRIYNQGLTAAKEIELVDYIPEGLILEDPDWIIQSSGNGISKAYYLMNESNGRLAQGGLAGGDSMIVNIKLRVNPNQPAGIIVNRAEISSARNFADINDDDSTPDDDEFNDPGGLVFSDSDGSSANPDPLVSPDDEDDADPAGIIVVDLERSVECFCLNNAFNGNDGQFYEELSFRSISGDTWFIDQVSGFYHELSMDPPNIPLDFVTGPGGYILDEQNLGDGTSIYTIRGIHIDGIGYTMVLSNIYGVKLNTGLNKCNYKNPVLLQSQNNVCTGQKIRYELKPIPNAIYEWTLLDGGGVISNPSANLVDVEWNGTIGSTYRLKVILKNVDSCYNALIIPVTIGNTPGPASCLGNVQVSLSQNCEVTVLPQMLLIGGPYDYSSYAVMIFNKDGSLVPNNKFNYSHIGKSFTAKVINVCSGNSCWTTILVEDKIKPKILCINDTIDCTLMKSYLKPFISDNCDPYPKQILVDEFVENTPCNSLYSKIVTRTYKAKDASGNESGNCTMNIYLKRINLDSIDYPDSLSRQTGNPLICNTYPSDSFGRPLPSFSGVPYYRGLPAWPNHDKYCDYIASYEDLEWKTGNDCVRKILRNWKFTIWYCNSFEQRTYQQLIEVVDTSAPVVQCPYDITATTSAYQCNSNVWIPMPKSNDDCTGVLRVDLAYPGGHIKDFQAQYINLPLGVHELTFTAYDLCYNHSSCSFYVTVEDQTPPVALCDRETVVTLNRFGEVWVPADVFDDGSYDDCHINKMMVRRMSLDPVCGEVNHEFKDSIHFCCEDLGKEVMVVFKVSDFHGNENTCMVVVEVQDKTIPQFTYCPHDVTISCHDHIDTSDLSQFGMPMVSDNCDITFREQKYVSIDQCREGYIDRVFTAGNSFGLDVCVQRIWIINPDPFDSTDITWPLDYETSGCITNGLLPETLDSAYSFPWVNEDFCDLVGISYTDHTFRFINNSDACYKIIRKWKIVNWCRLYVPGTTDPKIYTHDQILKVHNYSAPNLLTGCRDTVFNIIDTSCLGGDAYLVATADDDCTPLHELVWQYHIDLFSDHIEDKWDLGVGSTINASGFYPLGKHTIKYVFEDRCGNKSVCQVNFEIINCKPPTAYCKVGLSTSLVPMDLNNNGSVDAELVTIWAKDFDHGSFHPCGYPLTYSFGTDTSVKSITYDCDSIGRRTVKLCVTATNGKQDCCNTFIDIQDNNNVSLCGCVKFPPNVTITDCSQNTDPVVIDSRPSIGECTGCVHTGTFMTDSVVQNVPNTCFVVYRNWKVTFDCVGEPPRVFDRTQVITVTTDLKRTDIVWPSDSVIVDNCAGSIDTTIIGEVPRFCVHGGDVMLMFTDKEIRRELNCVFYERIWTVFSKCVPSQSYSFRQVLKVIEGAGIRYIVPKDFLVEDCRANFSPDSLNGYPKTNCPCDFDTHTYRDSIVQGVPNTCYIIYRIWRSTFNCPPDVVGTFTGIQKITVRVKLNLSDIMWPSDSVLVDNCMGNVDTGIINHIPKLLKDFCGNVQIQYIDQFISQNDSCRIIHRIWFVFNECSADPDYEQFSFLQVLKVTHPDGPQVDFPDDITVTDCEKPLIPDSLNGYPMLNCPCDVFTHTFQDSIVLTEPNTCYVVYRKWTSNYHCPPEVSGTFRGTQKITIKINLNPNDINWPNDTVIVDNCPGSVDTAVINNVPSLKKNYCGYVSFRYVDQSLSKNDTCEFIRRTWIASNDCTDAPTKQEFSFIQILKVLNPDEPRVKIPDDLTITDCDLPFDPDSLNGYPMVLCVCDSISFAYKDDTIFSNPEVCYMVERNWAIRFICEPNYDSTFYYIQKITRDVDLDPNDIIWPVDSFVSYTCIPTTDPKIIGEPSLSKDYCGFVTFSFTDNFATNSECETIIRRWTANNACSQSQKPEFIQIIELKNQESPVIVCPNDTIVSADGNTCGKILQLPNAKVTSNCNTGITITNNAPPVFPVGMTFVVFTAQDTCGHVVTCTTKVTVIENVPPEITCPLNLTISCGVNTDDLSQFGSASATDNCPGVTIAESSVRAQDICGIGTITRKFVAIDASGNRDSCFQLITVENTDPLDSLDVIWPTSPLVVAECGSLDPADTGMPEFDSTGISCLKAYITYADTNLCKVRNTCDIERTWTVYDTCSDRTFVFIQTIVIDDQNPPNILGVNDTTLYANDTACNNFVTLIAFVDNCDSANISISNNSMFGVNNEENASGFYPVGVTMVTFTAEDGCCNVATKTVTITIIDTIAPEFTCRKVVKFIEDDGCADFNSQEFILNIKDNCTDSALIKTSFNRNDFNDTIRTICCDSIRNFEYTTAVKVYFMDLAGNIDSCCTFLQAVDQDTVCGPTFSSHVKGFVRTRKAITMEGIDVMLNDGASGRTLSRYDGYYGFLDMPNGGSYSLKAEHDVNYLNGVSTADIIHIQRHILGLAPFTDEYKFIAADANSNNKITAADVVEIRKLVLGKIDRFAHSPSWKFILSDYKFRDKEDPLSEPYPMSYQINNINKNYYVDFTGIKIGDVDDNNDPTQFGSGFDTRNFASSYLMTEDLDLVAGKEYVVDISVIDFEKMSGLQFGLQLDASGLELLELVEDDETFVTEDYCFVDHKNNRIRVSFVQQDGHSSKSSLKFRIRAKLKGKLSEYLSTEERDFVSEAYYPDGEQRNIRVEYLGIRSGHEGLSLYQNIPNPFKKTTVIPFNTMEDVEITLRVISMGGQIVFEQKKLYGRGYHEVEISKNQLQNGGMYYYQLQTSKSNLFKRMILID